MSLPLRRMFRTSLFLTLLGTNAPLFAFQSLSTVPPEPQEPKIAAASAEAEQAMGSFRKPQNWQIELAAAEPDIANPVAFFVDNQGRLFVCETFRQGVAVTDNRSHDQQWLMADLAAKTVDDRIKYHRELLGPKADQFELSDDRIRLLKDKDGDGRYEEAVVFADHFNRLEDGTGAGVLVRGNDAYYTCIPKLWKLTDHDGDGKAEQRDVIYDGFGVRVAFRGHDMHGLIIGPDGRLYFSIGDRGYHLQTSQGIIANPESGAVFRCELDGSNLEVVATGLRNPQELAFDDHGNLFTGDNNSDSGDRARWVYIAEGGDTGWRMFYQYLSDRGPFNQERIWYPFDEQTPAYIVPPITNFADGPSGLAFYPGTGLGEAYRDTFFLCDFRGGPSNSGVRTFKVMPKGAFFELVESQEPIWNILATDVDFAPDGSVLVSDWVNGWEGEGKGRIYRFFDPRERESTVVQEVKKILAEGVKSYDDRKLALLLAHPDRRVRLEAQWELASRESIQGFATLLKDNSSAPLTRLHAVWGLGQIARVGANKKAEAAEALKQNLEHEDPAVQAAAILALSDAKVAVVANLVNKLLGSTNARVQYHASLAAGKMQLADSLDSLVSMIEKNADSDPILRHGGIMGLRGIPDVSQVAALSSHPSRSVRLAAVVALRKRLDANVTKFLGDHDPAVAVEAARAIHDEPALHANGLEALANSLAASYQSNPIQRRALNANYRLGTKQGAMAVAKFASDSKQNSALRLEAIEMLLKWEKPSELDWVMNRYLPIEGKRDAKAGVESLRAALPALVSSDEAVRQRSLVVAAELGITEVVPMLSKILADNKSTDTAKSQAIQAIVGLQGKEALPMILKQAESDSPLIRSTAVRLLAGLDPAASVAPLKKGTQSEVTFERQNAWDTIGKLPKELASPIVNEGIELWINGKIAKDTWLNLIESPSELLSKSVAERFAKHREELANGDPLAQYAECLEGGDPVKGSELFYTRSELSCVRCHKVGERGGEVGPALTQIGKQKDRRYLLEAIVNPDAAIAQNFETVVVLTDDDTIYTGILKKETDEQLQLVTSDGQIISIAQDTITNRKKGKSSMPADLVKKMTPRELRDLVAFLASLDGTQSDGRGVGGHQVE